MFIFKRAWFTSCLGFALVVSPSLLKLAERSAIAQPRMFREDSGDSLSWDAAWASGILVGSSLGYHPQYHGETFPKATSHDPLREENQGHDEQSLPQQEETPSPLFHPNPHLQGKTLVWEDRPPHQFCPTPSERGQGGRIAQEAAELASFSGDYSTGFVSRPAEGFSDPNLATVSQEREYRSRGAGETARSPVSDPTLSPQTYTPVGLKQRLVKILSSLLQAAGLTQKPPSRPQIEIKAVNPPHPETRLHSLQYDYQPLTHWEVWNPSVEYAHWTTPSSGEEFSVVAFKLLVNGKTILELKNRAVLDLMAKRLQTTLNQPDFQPDHLQPGLMGGEPAIFHGDRLLFRVNDVILRDEDTNKELLVINWVNNLRTALEGPPLELVKAQQKMYGVVETNQEFRGYASWYGPYFHGRLTANGETYNQEAFTAAHPYLPFNTYLKVTNLESKESIIVRINDRGPYVHPRTLDLSRGVARCLDSKSSGVVPYRAVVMEAP
ncbi:septal ring lytic transglycosylase RlpA family protein [Spirulina sp. CS-785/01]|uniref:septal ring lytic transglycosylase RlpA family protein n=1 Tax=Spirulina sp. CS-785/01 TaxID=3021716 RepID=UPI00232A8A10|nr:septal ring lytic transglycosylase RlpA family protein [Spirulina sp. CS-785/01]MDB9314101.1 septal ring lytic transglycosylase RlpA family protein [Spirulina sp. CS-785/01]